ncbi:MAG: iron-sulfur cluster assembly accessory protein [Oscillatoriales cyanobacterium]|jgi:iron-sulfur cluster assembly protein|nr:MAG: iron-sulfur cluster assembly accessory protein [Oscillatoriales cyanobacterium]
MTRSHPSRCIQLRLAIGECAQFVYQLQAVAIDSLEPNQASVHWSRMQVDDLLIAIEDRHANYLRGLMIDYSEDLMGGSFRFENPNATRTCSCGSAFDT